MEKEKTSKKSSSSIVILALAVLMIAAGVGLIITGNNKSLWNEKNDDNVVEEDDDDIPDRARALYGISEEEIEELINYSRESDFPDETWEVSNVTIIGHDENNEKILVSYGEVNEDLTIVFKQTIVTNLDGEKSVELPGWNEGERDLTIYNFIMEEDEDDEYEDEDIDEGEIIIEDEELDESVTSEDGSNVSFEEPVLEDYEYSGPSLDE